MNVSHYTMMSNCSASPQTQDVLSPLADELIANILLQATTASYFQFIQTSHRIFDIAKCNREVTLHHLHLVPGNKLCLDDPDTTNDELFLLLRQRLVKNLCGANFNAECLEWLSRDASIDPTSSAIEGFDSDYFRMSLVFKGSQSIRHYTAHCSLKERIDDVIGPGAKIMFLYQRKQFVAILCSWEKHAAPDAGTIFHESDEENCLIWTSVNQNLQRLATYDSGSSKKWPETKKNSLSGRRYRVLVFDVFSNDRPASYVLERHKDLVPKHFTSYHRELFAILWDQGCSRCPTKKAEIVKYAATSFTHHEPTVFKTTVVWPKTQPPRPNRTTDNEQDSTPKKFPKRIAFFKEGRRLKLWSEGEIVPFEIVNTESNSWNVYQPTNKIVFDDFSFTVDLPFFGVHKSGKTEQSDDPNRGYCTLTHLCLGVTSVKMDDGRDVKLLYVMRGKSRIWSRNCDCTVNVQNLSHVAAHNTTAVARLYGWQELDSNLTGLETVAISKAGTRIAIALWDKILVYPLEPSILCEDLIEDDENVKSSKKKKQKQKKSEKTEADSYYARQRDTIVDWNVAEVRPIVLNTRGAVVHKLSWTAVKDKPVQEDAVHSSTVVSTAGTDAEGQKHDEINVDDQEANVPTSSALDVAEESTSTAEGNCISSSAPFQPLESEDFSGSTNKAPPVGEVPASTNLTTDGSSDAQFQGDEKISVERDIPTSLSSNLHFLSHLPSDSSDLPIHDVFPQVTAPNAAIVLPPITSSLKDVQRKKEKAPEKPVNEVSPEGLTSIAYLKPTNSCLTPSDKNCAGSTSLQTDPVAVDRSLQVGSAFCDKTLSTFQDPSSLTVTKAEAATAETCHASSSNIESSDLMEMHNSEQAHCTTNTKTQGISTESGGTEDLQEARESSIQRHKRVTEDELVVLTDRGIQVWHVASTGNGTLIRRELRMDESLKGKLPTRAI